MNFLLSLLALFLTFMSFNLAEVTKDSEKLTDTISKNLEAGIYQKIHNTPENKAFIPKFVASFKQVSPPIFDHYHAAYKQELAQNPASGRFQITKKYAYLAADEIKKEMKTSQAL
jgi:K+-transporting ATPase A subunit